MVSLRSEESSDSKDPGDVHGARQQRFKTEGTKIVKEIRRKDKTLYVCEACGFAYEERHWAEECEEWCLRHHSCNIEIASHAVEQLGEEG